VTYWHYECRCDCAVMAPGTCLVSAPDMPVPEEIEGRCWVNGARVMWVLVEVVD